MIFSFVSFVSFFFPCFFISLLVLSLCFLESYCWENTSLYHTTRTSINNYTSLAFYQNELVSTEIMVKPFYALSFGRAAARWVMSADVQNVPRTYQAPYLLLFDFPKDVC